MQPKKFRTMDYAKREEKTNFKPEFNALREQLFRELRNKAKAKGWISELLYRIAKEPAFINWN
jgi:hypothetical protein